MVTVTSSEFQKNFGHFKEIAQREPIMVTSNGRESAVLLSRLTSLCKSMMRYLKVLPSERDVASQMG